MLRFLGGEEFLRYAVEHRIIYLAGGVGTGKSALAAGLAYMLLRGGLVRHCVSTMPLAFAIPADICPPYDFVAVMDELGVLFDARSFADREQNEFRRYLAAYMRKLNIYCLVASRVSPDVTFRSLSVQRVFNLTGIGLPLELYRYGFENGAVDAVGVFGVWDRAWLWRTGRGAHPSPLYGHEYVPAGFKPMVALIKRAYTLAQQGNQEPNWIAESALDAFRGWLRMESPDADDRVPESENAGGTPDHALSGVGAAQSDNAIHVGVVPEKARSGGVSYGV